MGRKQRVIYQTAILPAAGVLPQSGMQIPDEPGGVPETGGDRGGNGPLAATRYRTVRTVDYVGNLVFEDGDLKYIHTPTGFIEDGEYYHQLRDYQGNVRVVVGNDGTVYERNNYYPYGLPIVDEHYSTAVTPYKFGGKEFDTMNGLNLYDFEARFYDPALCQFTTADPLSERYCSHSPYLYCAGNPVLFIDPTGLGWVKVSVGKDTYIVFDPDVHNLREALDKFLFGNVDYLGENVYGDYVYGNGTSNQVISFKLFASGGFAINGTIRGGEYHHNNFHIGNLRNVQTSIFPNYGYYTGPFNPTYQHNNNKYYSYILPPKNALDYAAFNHDRAYDKTKVAGIRGVFSDKTIGADADLIKAAFMGIISSPTMTETVASGLVFQFFLFTTTSKTIVYMIMGNGQKH